MVRKSMRQTVSRMSVKQKKGRQSMMAPSVHIAEDEIRAPPIIPPCVRHLEAMVVLLVWIGFLPAAIFSYHKAVACFLALALLSGMLVHAYVQRPYCTEIEEHNLDFDLLHKDTERASESITKMVQEDHRLVFEEWRLVFFLIILLSSLGAAIGFGMGGDVVYHVMKTPGTSTCSVADLADLQKSYEKVRCQDGYVDLSQEVSFYRKAGKMTSAYAIYRMAPVYTAAPGTSNDDDTTGIPVAWAVTKDQHMAPSPCADGLCGLLLEFKEGVFVSDADREIYGKLKGVLYDQLQKQGGGDFNKESVPAILLTDPSDPFGLVVYLMVGLVCYAITLIGIICFQVHMLCEPSKKGDGASYNLLDRESLGHSNE